MTNPQWSGSPRLRTYQADCPRKDPKGLQDSDGFCMFLVDHLQTRLALKPFTTESLGVAIPLTSSFLSLGYPGPSFFLKGFSHPRRPIPSSFLAGGARVSAPALDAFLKKSVGRKCAPSIHRLVYDGICICLYTFFSLSLFIYHIYI